MSHVVKVFLKLLFVIAVLGMYSVNAYATDALSYKLPKFELVPGMQTKWIARQMAMNGVPMSVQAFTVKRSADDVLNYYEHQWKTKGLARVIRNEYDGEKSIGLEHRGNYFTVQAHDSKSGSEGMLTVSQTISDATISTDTKFPLMSGSQVMTKIDSNDFGQIAETLMVENNHSVSSNENHFISALQNNGWVKQSYSENKNKSTGKVLNFQKGNQLCQITIAKQAIQNGASRTSVVVNWIKKQ